MSKILLYVAKLFKFITNFYTRWQFFSGSQLNNFCHRYEENFPLQRSFTGCGIITLFFMRAVMLNSTLKKWARIDEEHMFDLKFQLLIEFLQDKLQEIPLCFFWKTITAQKKINVLRYTSFFFSSAVKQLRIFNSNI